MMQYCQLCNRGPFKRLATHMRAVHYCPECGQGPFKHIARHASKMHDRNYADRPRRRKCRHGHRLNDSNTRKVATYRNGRGVVELCMVCRRESEHRFAANRQGGA